MSWTDDELRVLEARTRALARAPSPPRLAQGERLTFRVAGETLALPTDAVRSVVRVSRLYAVPHAPPHSAGALLHDGLAVPAFHLRHVLALPKQALPEYAHAVLVGETSAPAALLVDVALGIEADDGTPLLPVPPTVPGPTRAFFRGLLPSGTVVLDADALLASPLLELDIAPPFLPSR